VRRFNPLALRRLGIRDHRKLLVCDNRVAFVGGFNIAAEYDGDQHRSDRGQYVKDMRRLAMLERKGWIVIRVIAEDDPADVVTRVSNALSSRGAQAFTAQ